MSPRRTRRGTIREHITETCNDSGLKSTSKKLRSTCRTNKSQVIKGSEEESDNPVEVNSLLDNASFVNDTSLNLRKRKRNAETVSTNQDDLFNSNVEESKNKSRTNQKNTKTPQSSKKVKSNKSQIMDVNLDIVKDEFSNTKSQKEKSQVSYSFSNLISEHEEIPKMASLKKKLKSDYDKFYGHKKEYQTPEKSQKALNHNVKLTEKEITPKSSPINVSLTPHRSTKTPKKSPINLGSPKTHAHDSFKLLNVQRKLSIVDSPSSSENSNNSLQQLNASNLENSSIDNTKKSDKSLKSVLKSSSSKKKYISTKFKARPRFSKSPKIVLRTPKSKSSKSMKKSSSKSASRKSSSSPTKSKKVSKANESLKSVKSPAAESEKLKKAGKSDSEKALKSVKSKDLSETKESPDLESPLNSTKTLESNSSSKSKESVKSIKSLKKETQPSTPLNSSINIPKKSKKMPIISPLSSKKMPKIILSTKKSSKSKSAKKSKKSVSPVKKTSRSVSPSKKSDESPKIATPLKVADVSVNLLKTESANKYINYSPMSSMSPKVVVNKLSSPVLRNSMLAARRNQPTINLIPVDRDINSLYRPKNQKVPSNDYKIISSIKDRSVLVNTSSNQDTQFEILNKITTNLKATNTSTPKQKTKNTLSLSSDKKILSGSIMLNGSSTPKPKAVKRLNNQSSVKAHQALLEDESEPSSNETSLINMSDVFDFDGTDKDITFDINKSNLDKRKSLQDTNAFQKSSKNNTFEINKDTSSSTKVKSVKDDTYELETSKIGLEMRKEESECKKSYRVHFVDSDLEIQANTINRVGTPGHAIQQKKILNSTSKTPVHKSFNNKIENRKSVSSVSKLQVKTPMNTPINKRLSNSLSDTASKSRKSIHDAQIASINRLSRPKPIINSGKKLGTKTPVTRKIPNFANIHQKNFEKMESLIDLKKRIEKRHLTLNSATPNTKKTLATKYQNGSNKLAPLDSTNGVYNKFGFKLRKNDAVSMISNKQAGVVESREQKREEARNILKGVRMNRRFELQMKSRIKNSK